jgi:hypothetical protein
MCFFETPTQNLNLHFTKSVNIIDNIVLKTYWLNIFDLGGIEIFAVFNKN